MKKFKIMKVKKEDIKIGDLMYLENRNSPRLVIDISTTFLHNHPLIKVVLNDGGEDTIMLCDLKPIISICRLEVKE